MTLGVSVVGNRAGLTDRSSTLLVRKTSPFEMMNWNATYSLKHMFEQAPVPREGFDDGH